MPEDKIQAPPVSELKAELIISVIKKLISDSGLPIRFDTFPTSRNIVDAIPNRSAEDIRSAISRLFKMGKIRRTPEYKAKPGEPKRSPHMRYAPLDCKEADDARAEGILDWETWTPPEFILTINRDRKPLEFNSIADIMKWAKAFEITTSFEQG